MANSPAPPRLILCTGPPCSGKSTLAAELGRRHGIPHLSMDATRQRILPDAQHTRADRQVAYRAMHMAAELLLRAASSVILDAPYGHPEDRAQIDQVVRSTGAELKVIECSVSPQVALQRFRQRGKDPIRLDLNDALVVQMVKDYPYRREGLQLDTDAGTPEECLQQAEDWLFSS